MNSTAARVTGGNVAALPYPLLVLGRVGCQGHLAQCLVGSSDSLSLEVSIGCRSLALVSNDTLGTGVVALACAGAWHSISVLDKCWRSPIVPVVRSTALLSIPGLVIWLVVLRPASAMLDAGELCGRPSCVCAAVQHEIFEWICHLQHGAEV